MPPSTNFQIERSSTLLSNISLFTLIDLNFQEESFLVTKKDRKKAKAIIREQPDIDIILESLNLSDYEEVAEIEPESDDEKSMLDYSAPDVEDEDKEIFEDIDNLDNSFGWILIWILRYQQRY